MTTHFKDYSGSRTVNPENREIASSSARHDKIGFWGYFREGFDKAFALLALIFLAPIFLAVCILQLLSEGRPIFFAHTRIGRNGKSFKCLKFRTMAVDADKRLRKLLDEDPMALEEWESTQKLEKDPRVTCLGLFLRKTSLDEVPQFLNVVKGDMSIVGPRPIVSDEIPRYGSFFCDYTSVKPGITGLWQVSGRNDTSYDERVALDVDYVRNRSFFGDLKIILRTVKVVFSREGAF